MYGHRTYERDMLLGYRTPRAPSSTLPPTVRNRRLCRQVSRRVGARQVSTGVRDDAGKTGLLRERRT